MMPRATRSTISATLDCSPVSRAASTPTSSSMRFLSPGAPRPGAAPRSVTNPPPASLSKSQGGYGDVNTVARRSRRKAGIRHMLNPTVDTKRQSNRLPVRQGDAMYRCARQRHVRVFQRDGRLRARHERCTPDLQPRSRRDAFATACAFGTYPRPARPSCPTGRRAPRRAAAWLSRSSAGDSRVAG